MSSSKIARLLRGNKSLKERLSFYDERVEDWRRDLCERALDGVVDKQNAIRALTIILDYTLRTRSLNPEAEHVLRETLSKHPKVTCNSESKYLCALINAFGASTVLVSLSGALDLDDAQCNILFKLANKINDYKAWFTPQPQPAA